MIERFSIRAQFEPKTNGWTETGRAEPAPRTYKSFDQLLAAFLADAVDLDSSEIASLPATLTIRMELRVKRPPQQRPIHTNVRSADRNAIVRELSRIENELRRLRDDMHAEPSDAVPEARPNLLVTAKRSRQQNSSET